MCFVHFAVITALGKVFFVVPQMNAIPEKQEIFGGLDTPIAGVPSHHIMRVWERVEPLFKRVVKPETGWSLKALLTALQLGYIQLWIIGNFQGVVTTQILERPTEKVLWVQFMAGKNMVDWLDDWIKVQEAFARDRSCSVVEFSGRKGWKKICETHVAYRPISTTFRREL